MIYRKADDFIMVNPKLAAFEFNKVEEASVNEAAKHYWLYALKLNDDKYYVGMTAKKNPYDRILQHGNLDENSYSATWTKLHTPLEVLEIRDIGDVTKSQAKELEQQLTQAYMKAYGYQKVRGGQVTYSGKIWKFGKIYLWGTNLELFIASMLLIMVSTIYLIEHFSR
jgi:predicted GIY-YIG superfamily endonuclease